MAKLGARSFLAGVLLAAVVLVVAAPMGAKGQSPSECKREKDELVGACRNVVLLRQDPSARCCERVRASRVQCVCPYVTSKVANLFNVAKIVRQIESCGRTVPRNFKCGTVTTPP